MDPFEEFEFKPLTEGLGFHKKKSKTAATDKSEDIALATPVEIKSKSKRSLELEDAPADLLLPPLPRKKTSSIPSAPDILKDKEPSTTAVDEILKTLQKNRHLDFEDKKAASKPKEADLAASSWSISAALLDSMLVLAFSLLCMIVMLMITKVDLIANINNPDAQGFIYIALGSLFAAVSFIYLTLNRIYMGFTPGEWAFDQQVGKPQEQATAIYCLRVMWRSLLTIATGFVVLPLISLLFSKDIAGVLSGARLYKKA